MGKIKDVYLRDKSIIHVGVGDFKISKEGYRLKTFLGCCLGVCLYARNKKVGALLHIVLPSAPGYREVNPAKYADTALREVIRQFKKKHKVKANHLTAMIFGGAKMIEDHIENVGKKNALRAKEVLRKNKVRILKEKVGGKRGYKIEFDVSTGMVTCQVFGQKEQKYFMSDKGARKSWK